MASDQVFREKGELLTGSQILTATFPTLLAFPEQVRPPIREAVVCYEDRIDGINVAEASGRPFLVEGRIPKGFFELMNPRILPFVSG